MQRIRTGAVALSLLLTAAAGAHAQSDTVRVTMAEAIERALRASPQIVRGSGSVATAEWAERTALGAFLPSASASSGTSKSSSSRFNPQTNTIVEGSSTNFNAGLSLSYDVFTGGRRGAQRRRAEANTTAAEASLIEQRFNVMLTTKRTFFDVRRAAELSAVNQTNVERAEQALDAANRRLAVGTATRSDVLRAQLELNNAKNALLNSQNQRRSAAYALGAQIGVEGPALPEMDSIAGPRALTMNNEQIVALAIDAAPAVRSAEATADAARASASVSRASYLPTVRFSSGYDWSNNEATFQNGNTSWNMRLNLSYPLFNGFTREADVANADIQTRNATVELQAAQRQARADAERVLGALRLAEEQLGLRREALAVAEEDLRVQQERYRLGMTTILELLTSQSALRSAESSLVNARYDYEIARAELEALVGREL